MRVRMSLHPLFISSLPLSFPTILSMNKKLVLAFSGGLDTSFCVKHLLQQGFEVHTITVDTGGFNDDELTQIEQRALSLGSASHRTARHERRYYETCLRYLIYGNVLKNGTYPLSVSAERVTQAVAAAAYAQEIGAGYLAHGSTGAGNDQVRFDMIFQIVAPSIEIITPIRDLKLSRAEEIEFLRKEGIEWDFTKADYSINKGLWGTSIGGRETLTSHAKLPDAAWPTQLEASEPVVVTLGFEQGELLRVNDQTFDHAVPAIQYLQSLAAPFAIGRDIHIGDTIIGIKGRVGFEAAAPLIIIKAHHALEKHVLGKWQLYWKDQMAAWYGNWLHEGQLLDPVMRDIEAFLTSTQRHVTGQVFVELHPYRFQINGVESAHDLMQSRFGSYGEMNNAWTGDDVKGFTKIFGNQTRLYHMVNEQELAAYLQSAIANPQPA